MNISGKIQSLKDIKQTIKSEAGKLGQKLNIKPQESSGSGKEKVSEIFSFWLVHSSTTIFWVIMRYAWMLVWC